LVVSRNDGGAGRVRDAGVAKSRSRESRRR
jgi:hypothetical protein